MKKKSLFVLLLFWGVLVISCNEKNQKAADSKQTFDSLAIVDPFIKMPEIIDKPDIVYPEEMKSYKKDVRVFVSARIDLNGNIYDVRVVKSSNTSFNKYAIDLANKFKFKAGEKDGIKSEMNVSFPIDFKFKK